MEKLWIKPPHRKPTDPLEFRCGCALGITDGGCGYIAYALVGRVANGCIQAGKLGNLSS